MGILQNNHHCYFINIHYGFYGIIKSGLFKYPKETIDSKSGAKEKRDVKFDKELKKKKTKQISYIKITQQNSSCCIYKLQNNIYLQTVKIYIRKIYLKFTIWEIFIGRPLSGNFTLIDLFETYQPKTLSLPCKVLFVHQSKRE